MAALASSSSPVRAKLPREAPNTFIARSLPGTRWETAETALERTAARVSGMREAGEGGRDVRSEGELSK